MLENKTFVLIDGNAVMHRAYHGVNKNFLPVWEGMPVGMLYGFTSTLINVISHFRPHWLAITFDTKEKTFRHEIDPTYKANRSSAPDDFYAQIPLLDECTSAFQLPALKCPGYESDDLIGTLTRKIEAENSAENFCVKIISGDLDFTQLVNENVELVKISGKIEAAPTYGPAETIARYGVRPDQMIDLKALVGDSSDNYKGADGIGPKTAAPLIEKYETLENLYAHIDEIKSERIRGKLIDCRDQVFHCQHLAAIKTDVPVHFDQEQTFSFHPETTEQFLQKFNFRALQNRYQRLINNYDQKIKIDQKNSSKKSNTEDQMSLF